MHTKKTWALAPAYVLAALPAAHGLSFQVPSTPPSNSSEILSAAPVGLSFEFFAFPGYMQDVQATGQCLANLEAAAGASPPVRIGGTTQDRATYDPSLSAPVSYTVSAAGAAPTALTYGPSFMSLAGTLKGPVTLGLNRRLNVISNGIAAAQVAVAEMPNLYAIELGNEPNFWGSSDPIAGGQTWTAARDASSQVSWQQSFGSALGKTNIIQAGVYFPSDSWKVQDLVGVEGNAAAYVKTYADHYYPQWSPNYDLARLMDHADIKSGVSWFKKEAQAAKNQSKPFIMGETNSATQGGGGISPTFGAALWILDYVMQAMINGIDELYFHQGTIGNCQYCWWGRYSMGAPYYGAYTAALALSGASRIVEMDIGSADYAAYVIYKGSNPARVLLYNSDYHTSGTRGSVSFTLSGITKNSVTARRLTSSAATNRVDQNQAVTIAGQSFTHGTCVKTGTEVLETTTVAGGRATFTVAASEALLITL